MKTWRATAFKGRATAVVTSYLPKQPIKLEAGSLARPAEPDDGTAAPAAARAH